MFKNLVKNGVRGAFYRGQVPVLVNSYGRSGSTLLMDSIVESRSPVNSGFLYKVFKVSLKGQAWDLDSCILKNGGVYKTHDYPPALVSSESVKMVYIFSDPIDVVKSLLLQYEKKGKEWMSLHFHHLGSNFDDFFRIIDRDILGLESHFEAWLKEERFPICFVRYEKLWENQEDLGWFLEVPLRLPPYRPRSPGQLTIDNLDERLDQAYGSFKEKVVGKEDVFTNDKGRSLI